MIRRMRSAGVMGASILQGGEIVKALSGLRSGPAACAPI